MIHLATEDFQGSIDIQGMTWPNVLLICSSDCPADPLWSPSLYNCHTALIGYKEPLFFKPLPFFAPLGIPLMRHRSHEEVTEYLAFTVYSHSTPDARSYFCVFLIVLLFTRQLSFLPSRATPPLLAALFWFWQIRFWCSFRNSLLNNISFSFLSHFSHLKCFSAVYVV